MRWRLILEEFGPDIKNISGEKNVMADAISRLPTTTEEQREQCTDAQDPARNEMFALDEDIAFPLFYCALWKEGH